MSVYQLAYFSLYGDFACADVTSALSLVPCWTHAKGEVLEGADVPSKTSTWDYCGPDEMNLQEQVDFLVATLWERKEIVQKMTKQFSADLNLSFPQSGVFALRHDALHQLAELNVTLNCFYGQDEDDDGD